MSKNKNQGTKWETRLVAALTEVGLHAERLPEAGNNDIGDIRIVDEYGDAWILEAKSRMQLNIHRAVAQADAKAERHGYLLSAVAWHRLLPKKKNQRNRQPAGPPIVAMDLATFVALLKNSDQKGHAG